MRIALFRRVSSAEKCQGRGTRNRLKTASLTATLHRARLMIASLVIFLSFGQAYGADFQVQPTTLDLGGDVKSGAFSVINNGNESINFQVAVKAWTQDSNGKDVYEDTKDIVFFPKIMTVGGNEQRAIRIGVKTPPAQKEKTYRLFIEEIPSAKKQISLAEGKINAGITIAFRFATPIFIKPLKEQEGAVVEQMDMSKGVVTARVRNTGTVHVKLLNVTFAGKAADGKELFSKEVAGWYVLHGVAVPYATTVPREICDSLATIEVRAKTEKLNFAGNMNVQKSMCAQ